MDHPGKRPVVIVGSFLNRSSEHIDTSIIAKRYEMELVNSGLVDMVADQNFRAAVREERMSSSTLPARRRQRHWARRSVPTSSSRGRSVPTSTRAATRWYAPTMSVLS